MDSKAQTFFIVQRYLGKVPWGRFQAVEVTDDPLKAAIHAWIHERVHPGIAARTQSRDKAKLTVDDLPRPPLKYCLKMNKAGRE